MVYKKHSAAHDETGFLGRPPGPASALASPGGAREEPAPVIAAANCGRYPAGDRKVNTCQVQRTKLVEIVIL